MLRRIKIDWAGLPNFDPPEILFATPEQPCADYEPSDAEAFSLFLDKIGLVGMGGSGFPSSVKIRTNTAAHTLVINGVECEPGVTIDQTILLHHHEWVIAGAKASARAVGAKRVILAVQRHPEHLPILSDLYPDFEITTCSNRYPAGAEKLILKKLEGKIPPPGIRPYQLGYLVQNVVSLRAIGRAIIDGVPVVERPLTLAMPSVRFYRNIIVPVGRPIQDIIAAFKLPFDATKHLIADSGLMMGTEVQPGDSVKKTTLSLIILERTEAESNERPCIRCGACNTSCPLGLHPYSLVERIAKNNTRSEAFRAQMTECFLCGVCSAVCPSDIPIVQTLKEGKKCL